MIINKNESVNLARFIKIIPKKFLSIFFVTAVFILISNVFDFYLPLVQQNLIDTAIASKNIINSFFWQLIVLTGVSFLVYIVQIFVSINLRLDLERFTFKYFFEKIFYISKDKIQSKGTGYYYDVLSADTENSLTIFDETLFQFIFSVVKSIFIIILFFKWDSVLFYNLIITYVFTIGVTIVLSKIRRKHFFSMRNSASRLVRDTIDSFSNNFVIKMFAAIQRIKNNINDKYLNVQKHSKKLVIYQGFGGLLINIGKISSFVFMLLYALHLIIHNRITYGILVAMINYFFNIFYPIDKFFALMQMLNSTDISIKRLLSIEDDSIMSHDDFSAKQFPGGEFDNLQFTDVVFSYHNDTSQSALLDVCFTLKKKEKLGIVGLSGEGKTSFLKLLLREITPGSGSITINDVDIAGIPYLAYMNRINILSQNIEIFNKDLQYNLTLGKKLLPAEEAAPAYRQIQMDLNSAITGITAIIGNNKIPDIKKSLMIGKLINNEYPECGCILNIFDFHPDLSGITEAKLRNYLRYIKQSLDAKECFMEILLRTSFHNRYILKKDFDEIVSLLELEKLLNRELGENGNSISGGEKNRIAFARFLLKNDYDFFILDEPFTSLDSKNEARLLNITREKLVDKTGIVISHKFNIILNIASEYLILENGRFSNRGNHDALITQSSLYKELYDNFILQRN